MSRGRALRGGTGRGHSGRGRGLWLTYKDSRVVGVLQADEALAVTLLWGHT